MSNEETPNPHRLDAAFAGGLAWTAGAKWVTQGVTWLSLIVTARLLSPADFGTVEIAGVYFTISNVLAEFGIGTAIVQLRELDRRVLAQINTVSLLFGLITFGCAALAAPFIAGFFRSEALRLLVIVNSSALLISAVQVAPQALLQRDMDYRRMSVAEAVQALLHATVTMGGAFLGFGYWALVVGPLVGKAAATALTVYWKPLPFGLPRWSEVMAPMRFGMEVAFSRVAWVVYSQADSVIVGRMLGESALGVYRVAMNLASAPAEKIAFLIMRVTGPLFARISEDRALVRRYFLFLSDALALAVLPLVCGLAIVAPEAVAVALGPRWEGSVAPLQWLAVFSFPRALSFLAGQALTSLRYTKFMMWMSFLSFLVMPAAFYVAAPWGPAAVAAAWLALSPVTMLPQIIKLFRTVDCGLRQYLTILGPAAVGSAAMTSVLLVLARWLPVGWPAWSRLSIEIACGGAVYGGVLLLFYRDRVWQYVRFYGRLREHREIVLSGKL